MKQRWLIPTLPERESTFSLSLDSPTRDELISLMAEAIEFICFQEAHLLQLDKGTFNDSRNASEDYSETPES